MTSTFTIIFFLLLSLATGFCQQNPGSFQATRSATSARQIVPAIKESIDVPLYVVNGIPWAESDGPLPDPNDILSVSVLRKETLQIFSCSRSRDVIVIQTKRLDGHAFIVRDKDSGQPLPKATLQLINADDTLTVAANEEGLINIPSRLSTKTATAMISYAGYLPLERKLEGLKGEVFLQKDIREISEVVVVSSQGRRCRRCGIWYRRVHTHEAQGKKVSSALTTSIYPNPVQKGSFFHLVFTGASDELMTLNLYSTSGNLVINKTINVNKGVNRLKVDTGEQVASGIYIVRVQHAKATLVNEKVLIQ